MTTPPSTPKSTIRNRKKTPLVSTQRFLEIAEIHNDTVLLKNGGMRAIIEVEAVNFNLKSEVEQQGIIAGYGAFVNTLGFPLQIFIRSTRTNIDDYLEQIRIIGEKNANPLLRQQTVDYVTFMQKLLDVADIMQKKFYVVVPIDRVIRKKTAIENFFSWLQLDDTLGGATQRRREFAAYHKQLTERVELIEAGLGNIGLHTKRLNTRDLLSLFYQIYNPQTSQRQKIPADLDALKLEKNVL
jgi:hypothetical protein